MPSASTCGGRSCPPELLRRRVTWRRGVCSGRRGSRVASGRPDCLACGRPWAALALVALRAAGVTAVAGTRSGRERPSGLGRTTRAREARIRDSTVGLGRCGGRLRPGRCRRAPGAGRQPASRRCRSRGRAPAAGWEGAAGAGAGVGDGAGEGAGRGARLGRTGPGGAGSRHRLVRDGSGVRDDRSGMVHDDARELGGRRRRNEDDRLRRVGHGRAVPRHGGGRRNLHDCGRLNGLEPQGGARPGGGEQMAGQDEQAGHDGAGECSPPRSAPKPPSCFPPFWPTTTLRRSIGRPGR